MEDMSILHLQEHWRTMVICIGKYLTRSYVNDCIVSARRKTENEIHRIQQDGTGSLQNCKTEFHSTCKSYYDNKNDVQEDDSQKRNVKWMLFQENGFYQNKKNILDHVQL